MTDDGPASLQELIGGRVDAVHARVDTGLVALGVYTGERRWLGGAIGPKVAGLGWLHDAPRWRTPATHPVLAVMRAHVVGHRVRDVHVDDDGWLWLVLGGDSVGVRVGVRAVRHGEIHVIDAEGHPVLQWPTGATHESRVETPQWHARGVLEAASDAAAEQTARTALLRAITQRARFLTRRGDAVRGDLARLESVEALQRTGRMLLAQGGRVPRGATHAQLEDWETGGTLEVTLDPARPAKAQAEGFFTRARRLQRGEATMRRRLDETVVQLARVEAVLEAAQRAHDTTSLEAAWQGARAVGVRDVDGEAMRAPRTRPAPRLPYLRFRATDERVVLVGRGAGDNDALTTRHAKPHDLWLHAKGVSGAHVVVPLAKGTTCPAELLVDAATLAAHFSDARGERVCEVSYVDRRYVRKSKGAAPGSVQIDREKVLVLRVEPERLQRLLVSRDEGA